ncbi:MAG: alpha-amylase family glycosyl hydrolase [bacterium]|nr:alpha-amylase family glycosyl hydrolase [bacterium]
MTKTKKDIGAILDKDGASFRVWAPFATGVSVTGTFNNWDKTGLESENDGYWFGFVAGAQAGQEYKYVIHTDNGELFKNDPRSLQLTTTAGNSVLTDTTFDWEGDDFAAPPQHKTVIYELHIGTFFRPDLSVQGTFASATEKLDYLQKLGINMIEIMPINSMPQDRGWGYAPNYIYAIESLYGGRHQFLEFVKAAHKRGIGITLDVVYNHFGPGEGLDLWQFDGWSQDNKGGIYFYNDWRSSTPWGETRPDYGRLEVQQYILDNVKMWLHDCHIDGLRLDSTIFLRNVAGHNNDPSNDIQEGWWLMQNINRLAHKIKPNALVIAEDSSGNEFITKTTEQDGAGFSAQWEVTFPNVLRQAMNAVNDNDRNLTAICDILTQNYNGDAFQRVVYSDSHDTDANGSRRLNEEISPGQADNVIARKRTLVAAAIVLTTPGIPMLFQGQEFMQDGYFNDWQALEWERANKFSGIVSAHCDLINLRLNTHLNSAGLSGHSLKILHLDDSNKVLAYHRWDKGGPGDDVIVVINFSNQKLEGYLLAFPREGNWHVRFNSSWQGYSPDFKQSGTTELSVKNGDGSLDLAPYSVQILSQD